MAPKVRQSPSTSTSKSQMGDFARTPAKGLPESVVRSDAGSGARGVRGGAGKPLPKVDAAQPAMPARGRATTAGSAPAAGHPHKNLGSWLHPKGGK